MAQTELSFPFLLGELLNFAAACIHDGMYLGSSGSVSIKVLEQDDVCQIQRDEQQNRNQRDLDTAKRIYKQMLKEKGK